MGYESLLITLNLITLSFTMTPQEISRYVSDGFVRAKAGEALAVYASVAPIHTSGALPPERHYSLGWIIYYALHQSAPGDILPRKRMLAHYLGLRTPRPHKLHSMILTEAIRLYRDARDSAVAARLKGIPHDAARDFSLVKFMRLWDFRHLRPGDWRRKLQEGKPMSATVEKLITHYVDELEGSQKSMSSMKIIEAFSSSDLDMISSEEKMERPSIQIFLLSLQISALERVLNNVVFPEPS